MVAACGFTSLHEMIEATVPESIKRPPMDLGKYQHGYTESEFLEKFKCAPRALPACKLADCRHNHSTVSIEYLSNL